MVADEKEIEDKWTTFTENGRPYFKRNFSVYCRAVFDDGAEEDIFEDDRFGRHPEDSAIRRIKDVEGQRKTKIREVHMYCNASPCLDCSEMIYELKKNGCNVTLRCTSLYCHQSKPHGTRLYSLHKQGIDVGTFELEDWKFLRLKMNLEPEFQYSELMEKWDRTWKERLDEFFEAFDFAELCVQRGGKNPLRDEDCEKIRRLRNSSPPWLQDRIKVPKKPVDCKYKMNHGNRGKAIIFNHEKFDNMAVRRGSRVDRELLKQQLQSLHFDVSIYDDLTAKGTREIIKDVTKDQAYLATFDCILIALLTYGDEEKIYARDNHYDFHEVWSKFISSECPALAGKPKMFLVVGSAPSPYWTKNDPLREVTKAPIGPQEDFLFVYGPPMGREEERDFEGGPKGSAFISAICQQLKERSEKADFLDVLTNVTCQLTCGNQRNASSDHKEVMKVPKIKSHLTKLLYLVNDGDPL